MWQLLRTEARDLQDNFQREIQEWVHDYELKGGRIFCGRGCWECCNLAVNATFTEALSIAGCLSDDRARRLRGHAETLRDNSRPITDLKAYLRMHRKAIGYCPFLDDDGSCCIYDMRPFSCRSLLATKESRFCGTDFSDLSRDEKLAFIASLDQTVVSFPMHYVASTQDRGAELESRVSRSMAERFGFSLYGSLSFLVYLELEHQLSRVIAQGYDALIRLLVNEGVNSPFLVIPERLESVAIPL